MYNYHIHLFSLSLCKLKEVLCSREFSLLKRKYKRRPLFFFLFPPFSLTVHAWLASHYGEIYGEILVLLLTEDPAARRQASAVYSPRRKVLRGALPLCVQRRKRDRARQLLAALVLQSALWVCRVAWVRAVRNNDSVTLCFPFDK